MNYKTSLDKTATLITTAVTVLFAVIIFGQFAITGNTGRGVPVFLTFLLLLIYFLVFAFRPVSYVVTGNELIVRRLLLSVHIKRADIKSVKLIDEKIIRSSVRTFGVGGMFGYYGKFAKYGLGNMTWYATRRDRTVLITTSDNRKIILTPDEPDTFITEFNP